MNDFESARQHISNAFAILDGFTAPLVAMRAQVAAWDLSSSTGEHAKAEEHRLRAKELVMRVADSFEDDEPLRKLLLSAPPVRRILEVATSA